MGGQRPSPLNCSRVNCVSLEITNLDCSGQRMSNAPAYAQVERNMLSLDKDERFVDIIPKAPKLGGCAKTVKNVNDFRCHIR